LAFKVCYSALYRDTNPWDKLAKEVRLIRKASELEEKNSFLLLHGGADISPSLYGEQRSVFTGAGNAPSQRDAIEVALAKRAMELGIPIVGICRGAQLMCALTGGKLIQDVSNHASSSHKILTYDGKTITTNSVHHQMMYPWYTDYELIAWAQGVGDNFTGAKEEEIEFPSHAYHGDNYGDVMEPEIVWFPQTKAFCVQGHPEWADGLPEFQTYVVDEFLKRTNNASHPN